MLADSDFCCYAIMRSWRLGCEVLILLVGQSRARTQLLWTQSTISSVTEVLRTSEKRLRAMGADLLDVGIKGADVLHIVVCGFRYC